MVVDEWAIMRMGLSSTLRRCGVNVVHSVTTATDLIAHVVAAGDVDIVVIGAIADMPQKVAVRKATEIEGVRVLVLASNISPASVMELCAEGATAVASREAADCDLTDAIESVKTSRRYVSPELLGALFGAPSTSIAKPRFDLTPREREILVELSAGRTNSEISERLRIGTETVKSHLTNIYDKLDVRRRAHAVSLAVAHGIV
jgi:two-component system NarL family response regulator